MAASYAYRQSDKKRRRTSRRTEVVLFFVVMATGLVLGREPLTWHNAILQALLYMGVIIEVFREWRQRTITVTSLDDRSMSEYGVEFEHTTPVQRQDLLKRYRVGTYLLGYFPDEYEEAQERESHLRAYHLLRFLLPMIAALYWLGWKWLPQGGFRSAWTDTPVIVTWLILFVLALPQMLRMWTEPDDPHLAEPKLVETAKKEA